MRNRLRATGLLGERSIEHLLATYGIRAEAVSALGVASPDLMATIDPQSGAIGAEVVFAVRDEGAVSLADILLRRTMVGLYDRVGIGPDRAAAEVAMRHLGWDAPRAEREIREYREFIARYHPRSLDQAPDAG